jgi:hypothetical protein
MLMLKRRVLVPAPTPNVEQAEEARKDARILPTITRFSWLMNIDY